MAFKLNPKNFQLKKEDLTHSPNIVLSVIVNITLKKKTQKCKSVTKKEKELYSHNKSIAINL